MMSNFYKGKNDDILNQLITEHRTKRPPLPKAEPQTFRNILSTKIKERQS